MRPTVGQWLEPSLLPVKTKRRPGRTISKVVQWSTKECQERLVQGSRRQDEDVDWEELLHTKHNMER